MTHSCTQVIGLCIGVYMLCVSACTFARVDVSVYVRVSVCVRACRCACVCASKRSNRVIKVQFIGRWPFFTQLNECTEESKRMQMCSISPDGRITAM